MSQISLQNKDTRVLKAGDYVKFAPNTRTACIYTLIGDSNIIGTCAEEIYPGRWGLVNLLNTVNYNDLIDKPVNPGGGTPSVSAANVSYVPTSPLTATNVQNAIEQVAALAGGLTQQQVEGLI